MKIIQAIKIAAKRALAAAVEADFRTKISADIPKSHFPDSTIGVTVAVRLLSTTDLVAASSVYATSHTAGSKPKSFATDDITENEHFEFKGDVHITGNIGKNATVIITDGSLIVDGNIEEGADITLKAESSSISISSSSFWMSSSSVMVGGSTTSSSLHVKGDVRNRARLTTTSADIDVAGIISAHVRLNTQSGDVAAREVKESVSIQTMSGDVRVGNVSADSSLNTMSGNIQTGTVGAHTTVKSMSGDIRTGIAHASAEISSMSGDVRVHGRSSKEKDKSGVSIVSHSSIFSNARAGGRIIINGKDVTDLVNAKDEKTNTLEKPVRYKKK